MTVDEFRRALASRKAEQDAKNQISESERQHRKNKATGGYDPYTNRYQWQLDLDREQGARVETAISAEIERMRRTRRHQRPPPRVVDLRVASAGVCVPEPDLTRFPGQRTQR